MKFDGRVCHDILVEKAKPILTFDENRNFEEYRKELREKFMELTGLYDIEKNAALDPDFQIEEEVQLDGYKRYRITFESEVGAYVLAYVLIPDGLKKGEKRPLVFTQQGHSSGVHNSVGIELYEGDKKYQETRGMFAVQSVKQGYITVAVENRAMGERAAQNITNEKGEITRIVQLGKVHDCFYEEMTGMLLGRCNIGERCFDMKCAIDVMLKHFGEHIDEKKIVVTGNSGGGTVSFYSACYDERIALSVPSCAFCPYPDSILQFYHCSCNYIPSAFKWFDMQDLSALIAPRRLVLVNGEWDHGFLAKGVRKGYETVKKVYEKAGVPDNCASIIHQYGHFWAVEYMWPLIHQWIAKI